LSIASGIDSPVASSWALVEANSVSTEILPVAVGCPLHRMTYFEQYPCHG
jgi:hypothetical protein